MTTRHSGIMPCSVETCRFPTRAHRVPAKTYPFPTRGRRKGMCHVCHYATMPKVPAGPPRTKIDPDDPPNPATQTAHDAFLAGRQARKARAARRMAATNPRSTR